jgi:hypothetical protein
MRIAHLASLTLAVAAMLPAGESLGTVERVDGDRLWIRFADAPPRLGQVLTLAGSPRIERHPLTGQVIIERPRTGAKAQVTAVGPVVEARIFWRGGPAVEPGFDAVPAGAEAAPNGAPGPTAPLVPVAVAGGAPAEIRLPLADPDGDATAWRWALQGPAGRLGRLEAGTGRTPLVRWFPPATGGAAVLAVQGRDALGQTWSGTVALSATPSAAPNPGIGQRLGGPAEPAFSRLVRRADGRFAGIDPSGRIHLQDAGWSGAQPVATTLRRTLALAVRGDTWAAVDADARQFVILAADGSARAAVEGLVQPTDATGTLDGWAVADARLGGVVVVDPDGRWRCLLGRASGPDAFRELTRVTALPDGSLLALDPAERRIHRWDRWLRPQPAWSIPADAGAPVDIDAAGTGALVLAEDGRLTLIDAQGRPAGSGLGDPAPFGIARPGKAGDLLVDGDIAYVCWPEAGLVVRAGAPGAATGVRGASLRIAGVTAIDGAATAWTVDADTRTVLATDAEGWVVARRPVPEGLGSAIAAAVTGDGTGLHLLDGSTGMLSSGNQQVVRMGLPAAGTYGGRGSGPGQFADARSIAIDDAGRTYVLDEDAYRISVFSAQGVFRFSVGAYGKTTTTLREPALIAVAPAGDRLYVYDADGRQVKRFDLDHQAGTGAIGLHLGGKGDGPLQFRAPIAMAVDRRGALIVADGDRADIQAIDATGASARFLWARRATELGLRGVASAACSPDGHVLVGDGAQSVWLRW